MENLVVEGVLMKVWISTNLYEAQYGSRRTRIPDLGGYEMNSGLSYSVLDRRDGSCLTRVAGPKQVVDLIVAPRLTDEEARSLIKLYRPGSELWNVDVADPEIDELARGVGLDPYHERVRNGKYGGSLWEQEPQIIKSVARAAGVSISDKELDNIRHGRCDAHENVLSKLRQAKPFAM